MTGLRVASDIGGTFTDTVMIDEGGSIGRFKVPTVPSDPAAGVLATLELAAADMGLPLRDLTSRISFFSHGTTVATNALLEGKVARTALIQTRGFGDTVSIMRGFKSLGLAEAEVKDFRTMVKQAPVVSRQLIGEATERIDYRGRVVVPLDEEDARLTVRNSPPKAQRCSQCRCFGPSRTRRTSAGSRRSSRRRRRARWSRSLANCCRAWVNSVAA